MGCRQSRIVYSVPINSLDDCKGESQIYRSPQTAKGSLTIGFKSNPEVQTYQDIFLNAVRKFGDKGVLGTREVLPDGSRGNYIFKSFNEIKKLCTRLGSGIVNLDLAPLINDYEDVSIRPICIYSKNREEWVDIDLTSTLYGFTVIPIYDTLGMESVNFIFEQTSATTCFCSSSYLDSLLKSIEKVGSLGKLSNLIALDPITDNQKEKAKNSNITLYTWEEIQKHGEKVRDFIRVTPEHIFTFNYTSGTTGKPKAAMLTHGNLVASCSAINEIEDFRDYGENDVHLSYLPLAHVMERVFTCWLIYRGGQIGFYSGDIQKLTSDLQALKPTYLQSVPRLFNKFHDAMKGTIKEQSGSSVRIAERAIQAKLSNLRNYGQVAHSIYDTIVFKKMRNVLGGKIRLMLSASAPIATDVIDFMKIAVSVPIIEAYGQTESTACSFMTKIEDGKSGHVGGPINSIEFKLVDIPEMHYTSKDKDMRGESLPRGEICLRGPTVFKGYYKEPEKTSEVIDKDGWLHTGDVGQVQEDGSLKVIDRKSNIFKLAIGEYISPEKIEKLYLTSEYISSVFLYGEPIQHYSIVIAVPEQSGLKKLAEELQIEGTPQELCQNEKIKHAILNDINTIGKEGGLFTFELAKKIHLEPTSFLDDFLTPSMKLKRHLLKKHYEKVIKQLYSSK